MADLTCCGAKRKAESHRLICEDRHKAEFDFQRFYPLKDKCPKCQVRRMCWRGELPDGTLSQFYDIDPGAHAQWLRRIDTDVAKPEAQLMSEWSYRVASGQMTSQIQYQTQLCNAKRFYKGSKVNSY